MSLNYTINMWGYNRSLDAKTSDSDPDYTYVGYCLPLTPSNVEGWAIIRFTKADNGNTNNNTMRWANGRGIEYIGAGNGITWDNKANYVYEP